MRAALVQYPGEGPLVRGLYSLVLYALAPLVLLRLLLRGPAYRRRWRERFGYVPPLAARPRIWLHAVSVGEVQAASPLIQALLQRHPDHELLVTTTTPTGSAQLEKLFGGRVRHLYMPYDLPGVVRRFLGRVRPRLVLIMETEIWPNLFHACARRGIPLLLVNARLSARSAAGYRRVRRLTAATLSCLDALAAQGRADAERLIALGAAPDRVQVTGNTKFDVTVPASLRERAEVLRREWGLRHVWIAGSTHEGEDAVLLAAHRRLRERFPDALLVLVPRHPERFAPLADALRAEGWRLARRSAGEAVAAETEVYLGDTMGELLLLYAAADVAFVGGSLVEVGGHNPLEPAALGLPVLFGPHHFNFEEISRLLREAGGAREVADAESLAREVGELFADPNRRHAWGEQARQVVAANRGARDRVLAMIEAVLLRTAP
ncbi:lipid IV(A) 3-deoxy-D-manno-octulosonic acid transferase [Thiohalobacter sp. IOR34]|uniref:lipid IV(A) 3-deoxy-D-manno-octulosonic acid transferase n=1 Tax=Thiohalobacter sp. IOR34 TaxID=3057176 RepID=UPI0025AF0887|nr:lipid IV(A) 3-deoxy-D-manno-octulosonic acid transferase [Thiohalobacter sp. IOR34]WJW75261.1 lipid IV(A) 3-deoxy-D-manno-octulosonic acid transferase [Thiohalobacter sp. IOR34]